MSRGRLVTKRTGVLALAALVAGLTASALRQDPPVNLGRPVTVLVTAAVGDGGVANAEVNVLDRKQLEKEWGDMKITPLFSDWEDLRQRVGAKYTTDFGGTVIIPRPAERCYITVRIPGQFGFSEMYATEPSPFLMKLEVDQILDVQVVDASGKPVSGLHVGVSMPNVRQVKDRLDEDKEIWLIEGATGPDGVAHLEHMQRWKVPPFKELRENPTQPRVGTAPVFAQLIRANVDLEKAVQPAIRLTVPPTGRVIVPLPRDMKAYARVRAALPGMDIEKRPWPLKVPYRVETHDGRAVFEHVGLGLDIDYEVWWQGLAAPRRGRAPGPKQPGEEVTMPRLDTFKEGAAPPKNDPKPPK